MWSNLLLYGRKYSFISCESLGPDNFLIYLEKTTKNKQRIAHVYDDDRHVWSKKT